MTMQKVPSLPPLCPQILAGTLIAYADNEFPDRPAHSQSGQGPSLSTTSITEYFRQYNETGVSEQSPWEVLLAV